MIEVLDPGLQMTLQDFGRFGYLSKGLTRGGPADEHAFLWANKLLGNRFDAAQLEITLGGARLKFQQDCSFVVTGAEVGLQLDEAPLQTWQTYTAKSGQVLSLSHAKYGLRAYLAVPGGFTHPTQWGSVATVSRERVGGPESDGQVIAAGQQLNGGDVARLVNRRVGWRYRPDYAKTPTLGLIPGNQYDEFSTTARENFCFHDFTVDNSSNRMGVRLTGHCLNFNGSGIVSEGINIGSVQVPPNGEPIIMLCDRQTLGGYPKLGTISPLDVSRLAQCRPGEKVRFSRVSIDKVQQQLARYYRFFEVQLACHKARKLRS
ncbi:biotin-dependent carboxyltransferase family protein [Idiomarina seosinensis]|uniref:5-oxoprolinase subunit C family protein n=1 Tax=Idiomarina seosinensis TaxID=281739 RepID=UPI00384AF788